jgi:nitrile hydratase accessory protein
MANGEVVFEAPWQSRVFGMARALADAGAYDWNDFRARLIEEISAWDRQPDGEYAYYDHFMRALERLLAERGLVAPAELSRRVAELAARPPGHDHHHDHDHHGHGE